MVLRRVQLPDDAGGKVAAVADRVQPPARCCDRDHEEGAILGHERLLQRDVGSAEADDADFALELVACRTSSRSRSRCSARLSPLVDEQVSAERLHPAAAAVGAAAAELQALEAGEYVFQPLPICASVPAARNTAANVNRPRSARGTDVCRIAISLRKPRPALDPAVTADMPELLGRTIAAAAAAPNSPGPGITGDAKALAELTPGLRPGASTGV